MFFKALYKTVSVVMALLVLVSTLSFTIEKHFCGNTLVDVAVFSKARSCGMNMENMTVTSPNKKQCCKDELEVVKGQDKLKTTTFDDIHFGHQCTLTAFTFTFIHLFEGLPKEIIPHKDYSPPNLVADIQVLDQVFII